MKEPAFDTTSLMHYLIFTVSNTDDEPNLDRDDPDSHYTQKSNMGMAGYACTGFPHCRMLPDMPKNLHCPAHKYGRDIMMRTKLTLEAMSYWSVQSNFPLHLHNILFLTRVLRVREQ